MTNVSNSEDVLDSRDVIARIAELEEEIEEARAGAVIHTACRHCGLDIEGSEDNDDWYDRGNNTSCGASEQQAHEPPEGTRGTLPEGELAEEVEELRVLKALEEEAQGYSPDWTHGATLIRDSYFVEYAEQFADDIGAIDRKATWPLCHIDWNAAAESLKQDYTRVDFDGVEYWIR